ncbi:MAG TPA: hypothetical protein VFI61_03955 [Patescibacteria group bacterium]|nr:hypothetical protein [Patescibacteria group bacterium]
MATNDKYQKIITTIIKAQEEILGPLAKDIANDIPNLDQPDKKTLEDLVKKYADIFGQASVETCKEAARDLLSSFSQDDIPDILK